MREPAPGQRPANLVAEAEKIIRNYALGQAVKAHRPRPKAETQNKRKKADMLRVALALGYVAVTAVLLVWAFPN